MLRLAFYKLSIELQRNAARRRGNLPASLISSTNASSLGLLTNLSEKGNVISQSESEPWFFFSMPILNDQPKKNFENILAERLLDKESVIIKKYNQIRLNLSM